jgi:hypothetical protein
MAGEEIEAQYSRHFFAPRLDPSTDFTLGLSAGYTTFAKSDFIPKGDNIDQSSQALLALVDFGLQKLLLSAATKGSDIHVIENNLQSLCKLAPVIFNPKYREVRHEGPYPTYFLD